MHSGTCSYMQTRSRGAVVMSCTVVHAVICRPGLEELSCCSFHGHRVGLILNGRAQDQHTRELISA